MSDFAKPAGLTDEGLFKVRTEKVMFSNPPGTDGLYARVHSFGRSFHEESTITKAREMGSNGWSGDFDRTKLSHIRGFGDGKLSVTGRPVK
jgi:hypothetical protein